MASVSSNRLYFKKELLLRQDAISYSTDHYGRVTDDFSQKNRNPTIDNWLKIADESTSNETIFKNSVTLLDNIDIIAVVTEKERKATINAFKKNGITKLPDGRKIKDIVQNWGNRRNEN